MKYLPIFILFLALSPFNSATATDKPDHLRKLDRPYRSGDWVLQCDSSRICRIIGVVRKSGRKTDVRTIVALSRGIEKNAKFHVRFAFVNNAGVAITAASPTLSLYPLGLFSLDAPVPLSLVDAEGEPGFPFYRPKTEPAAKIIKALQRWPGAMRTGQGKYISRMPQGDLKWLIRKMNKLQHPGPGAMTKAEEAEWMKEYHYHFVRAKPAGDIATPPNVVQACETAADIETWKLDAVHTLWISHCSSGSSLFLRREGEAALKFDMRDSKREIQALSLVRFDPDYSMLELGLAKKAGREDCGRRVRFVFTDQQEFGTLEDRRYDLCRGVPPAYWPLVWSPTSWKFIE